MGIWEFLLHASVSNLLIAWILLMGAIGFCLMGIDKLSSKISSRRIRQRTIWMAGFAGGFIGIIAGAVLFRHKVSKGSFWPPVLAAAVLWIAVFVVVELGD